MIVRAGMKIFGIGADQRGAPRGAERLGRQRALDLGEVRRPVAEREHEPEAEDDRDERRPERVVDLPRRRPLPRVEQVLLGDLVDLVLQAGPAADVVQRDDRQRHERGEDHEELQHLVVDRRGEAAERDVAEHDRGGDDDAEEDRPAEQDVQHERQRVEVHAGDQHGGEGEDERVEDVRRLVEAQPQVLGDRPDLRPVVEGHHHDPEEDHRRDGADPVVVDRVDAELRAVGRHAQDLQGAEVGRDEGEAGDPGRERASREEVVEARLDVAAGGEADPEDHHEVDDQDQVVDPVRRQPYVHASSPS